MKYLLITISAVLLGGCEVQAPKGSVHIYAQEGNIIAVKKHLAAGTNIHAKDEFLGITILQSAVLGGQKEVVELLIAEGANVNAKERKGLLTALDTAIIVGDKQIRDLLRKHGAKTGEELKAEGK